MTTYNYVPSAIIVMKLKVEIRRSGSILAPMTRVLDISPEISFVFELKVHIENSLRIPVKYQQLKVINPTDEKVLDDGSALLSSLKITKATLLCVVDMTPQTNINVQVPRFLEKFDLKQCVSPHIYVSELKNEIDYKSDGKFCAFGKLVIGTETMSSNQPLSHYCHEAAQDVVVKLYPNKTCSFTIAVDMGEMGTITQLEVKNDTTIEEVKGRICKMKGIPTERQLLTLDDEELLNEQTLAHYCISRLKTLQLAVGQDQVAEGRYTCLCRSV